MNRIHLICAILISLNLSVEVIAQSKEQVGQQDTLKVNADFQMTDQQLEEYRSICDKFYEKIFPLQKDLVETRFRFYEAIHKGNGDEQLIRKRINDLKKEIREMENERRWELKKFIKSIVSGTP